MAEKKQDSPHIMISKDLLMDLEAKASSHPLYCENDNCNVLIYTAQRTEHKELMMDENCPGCGRFGRKKGNQ